MSEHDLEYGPNPPGAKYEHTDIDVNVGYKFALWLSVAMLISVGIVYGAFWFFEAQERTASELAQKYPLAVGQQKAPPAPNLQTQPFKDLYSLRQAETARLTAYGWVDKGTGVTRIPIDDAMRLVLERGMVKSRPDPGGEVNQVMSDSSAGRVVVRR